MGAINMAGIRGGGQGAGRTVPCQSKPQPDRPAGLVDTAEDVAEKSITSVQAPDGRYVPTGSAQVRRKIDAKRAAAVASMLSEIVPLS